MQTHKLTSSIAQSFWQRFRGLMLTSPQTAPLFIPRCRSVHTCFMRYPLDLVWIDSEHQVVRIDKRVQPWRARTCLQAAGVVEFSNQVKKISVGDKLFLTSRNFKITKKIPSTKHQISSIGICDLEFGVFRAATMSRSNLKSKISNLKFHLPGQALVETAFMLPVLFLLLFGFLQLSSAMIKKQELVHTTNYAVQVGGQTNNDDKIAGVIEDRYNSDDITVEIENFAQSNSGSLSSSARRYGDTITLTVEQDLGIANSFLPQNLITLQAQASAVVLCNNNESPYTCD